MSIKTNFEIPRSTSPEGLRLEGQRLAQDLSTNFKAIEKQESATMSIVNMNLLPIGTVISSMLTIAQISANYGSGWVQAIGQSVAGSTYAGIVSSTVPNIGATAIINTTTVNIFIKIN